MVKHISISFLLFLSFFLSYGQKAKVQTAFNFYKEPYQQFDKAKEAIDEAIINEQSAAMAKTWYYRGLIYNALYKNAKYGQLCDNCLAVAVQSFEKANQLDPKNEWADEIKSVRIPLIVDMVFKSGVENYRTKDYTKALSDFETVLKMSPKDTAVILNSAYSAERAGNKEKAKQYYSQLIDLKYPDDDMYLNLSNIYRDEKDTLKALTTVQQGRAVYPDSLGLVFAEINLFLALKKNEEASKALNAATQKDPNNPSLYLALGSTFDNLANPKDANQKDLPKPANYNEYVTKAEDAYKKGIAISPDNYELNFNLGGLYFNQAADMANKANALKSNDEFAKAKVKVDAKFKESQPFLEKALDKNPKATADDLSIYSGTVNSLKQLYVRTGETEKYNKMKALQDQK